MKILEEFYYGNITPYIRQIQKGSEQDKLLTLVVENEEKLKAALNDEQNELFSRFRDSALELQTISECDCFVRGYRLGVQMMAEIMEDSL